LQPGVELAHPLGHLAQGRLHGLVLQPAVLGRLAEERVLLGQEVGQPPDLALALLGRPLEVGDLRLQGGDLDVEPLDVLVGGGGGHREERHAGAHEHDRKMAHQTLPAPS
jgi:hypothetical protein